MDLPGSATGFPAPDVDGAWRHFSAERAEEIEGWLRAEAELSGRTDPVAGDQLLAAEAALQRAIVDFAPADHEDGRDPMALPPLLLRRPRSLLPAGRC